LDGHVPAQQPLRDLVAVCFAGDLAAMSGENATLAGDRDEIVKGSGTDGGRSTPTLGVLVGTG
jgi:hypothetical protein